MVVPGGLSLLRLLAARVSDGLRTPRQHSSCAGHLGALRRKVDQLGHRQAATSCTVDWSRGQCIGLALQPEAQHLGNQLPICLLGSPNAQTSIAFQKNCWRASQLDLGICKAARPPLTAV